VDQEPRLRAARLDLVDDLVERDDPVLELADRHPRVGDVTRARVFVEDGLEVLDRVADLPLVAQRERVQVDDRVDLAELRVVADEAQIDRLRLQCARDLNDILGGGGYKDFDERVQRKWGIGRKSEIVARATLTKVRREAR